MSADKVQAAASGGHQPITVGGERLNRLVQAGDGLCHTRIVNGKHRDATGHHQAAIGGDTNILEASSFEENLGVFKNMVGLERSIKHWN